MLPLCMVSADLVLYVVANVLGYPPVDEGDKIGDCLRPQMVFLASIQAVSIALETVSVGNKNTYKYEIRCTSHPPARMASSLHCAHGNFA
jgi:hypothetical protein